jgi:hypothetical protein
MTRLLRSGSPELVLGGSAGPPRARPQSNEQRTTFALYEPIGF